MGWSKLVDELLDSPRYAERWARIGWTLCATPEPTATSLTMAFPTLGGIEIR